MVEPSPSRTKQHLSEAKEKYLLEGQRTYIAINGAGAIALLTFMQAMWDKTDAAPLRFWILFGVLSFAAGVIVGASSYPLRHLAFVNNAGNKRHFLYRLVYWYVPAATLTAFLLGIGLPMVGVMRLS